VSLDIQYFEGFTDLTPNLYYSTSDDRVFLTWLNYVTSQPRIRLAGSWQTDEEDHTRTLQRAYFLFFKFGRDYGAGEETTTTHDSFVWPHLFPIFPATCTFLSFHASHNPGTMAQDIVQPYEPLPACPVSPARHSDFVSTASRTQVARRLRIFSSSRLA
jgi:hypothetical protein